MRRREFITLLGGALAWPLAVRGQSGDRVRLMGWLDRYDASIESQAVRAALQEGLATLGWIEGRNLKIERRFGIYDANRLRAAAAELVSLGPDVIFAGGGRTGARVARCDADDSDRLCRGR
jgi:putative ABC transport system substrate-binding protein